MHKPIEVLSRRSFIKVSAGTTASLVIGLYLESCAPADVTPTGQSLPTATAGPTLTPTRPPIVVDLPPADGSFEAGAYLTIDPDGQITITVNKVEIGQGVRTALALSLADELDADWSTVRVVQADAGTIYGNQYTAGSATVEDYYGIFRIAGAAARLALVNAAAAAWGVDPAECTTRDSFVIHQPTASQLTYGELVAVVDPDSLDGHPPLKDPSQFRLIGTRVARVDGPDIVTGRATYGLDVPLPDALHAVVARCPVFEGTARTFDDRAARATPGVVDIVDLRYGVAVIAEHTWAAMQGRAALSIEWDEGQNATLRSEDIRAALRARVEAKPASVEQGGRIVLTHSSVYEVPYLAHATMEPMNGVVDFRGNRCEVWASTQDPAGVGFAAARATGLTADQVTVHVTQVGGGFGRRLESDMIAEAARISQAIRNPVKVLWTREDDMRHDFYRPPSAHSLSAGLDESGMLLAWDHHISSYGLTEGALTGARTYYQIEQAESEHLPEVFAVPTGSWRAVYNTQNAFAVECFIDELAELAGRDPYQYRAALLHGEGLAVLDRAAREIGWQDSLPPGWGRGIAFWRTSGRTPVAIAAEVSTTGTSWRVERVVCAVNCGQPVNVDGIEAQMEGGILGALAAMRQEITVEDGRVVEGNFDAYRPLRIGEAPTIDVHIIDSAGAPTGVGEMSGPPTPPAVVNALYAASGVRYRRLPITTLQS